MIMIYEPSNTNFDKNGDGIINALQCKATFNLDGNWSLYLEAPIDENMKYLQQQSVISVNTPYGKKQRYRIYSHDKNETTISVTALPVFYDSKNDCILKDIRPTNKNGQDAIDMMTDGTQYTGSSNITKLSTAYYVYKNLMEAINGSDDNSFLNRWGGEIVYQNTHITINEKIGEDRGLRAEFGFNIQGISENVEWENVVTRIYPKSYNGYMLPNNETVDSPNINKYPVVYTRVIEYQDIKLKEDATESDEENGTIICETMNDLYNALRERAQEEYENGIDVPNITYSVDMIDLSRTKLYEKYKELLNVYLGDIVHIKHKRLGIKTVERVITLTYDCIAEKVESLVLGDYEANYFNDVSSIANSASKVINTSNNTLMADKIAGIINLLNTSLRAQKDIAQKQDVRAILFEDLDESSPTFGALCIGTQGIQIAKERNETNTDWQWGTAIDFQSINADYIIAGILTDKNGNFYLNMNTGDLRMKNGTFVGNITGSSINGSTIIGSTFKVQGTRTYNVSINDVEKIRQAMLGNYTPTDQEMMNWDIDNDGVLSASDMLYVERIANGTISKTFNVEIDLQLENNIPRILIRQYNSQKEFLTKLSYGSLITESVVSSRLEADLSIKSSVIELGNDNILYTIGLSNYTDEFNKSGKCININAGWLDSKQKFSDKVDFIKTDTDIISGHLRMRTGTGDYLSNTYIFHDYPVGYLCFGTGDGYIDSYGGRLYLDFKDSNETYDMFVRPRSNGKSTLGDSNHRFYNVYLTHSPNVSSDRRAKKDFANFDERYIKLFEMIEPIIYQLKSAPESKSKLSGFIAQDIEGAMNKCGIDKREFGIVKYDEESDGYALIYDMFIPLTFYYIQTKQKEFDKFKENVEKRLSELEVK